MRRYLKFVMENTEPIRISNDETSERGKVDTLKYIPGSSIRGLVVNSLIAGNADFEGYKTQLFSGHIQFLNAYLTVDGRRPFLL